MSRSRLAVLVLVVLSAGPALAEEPPTPKVIEVSKELRDQLFELIDGTFQKPKFRYTRYDQRQSGK